MPDLSLGYTHLIRDAAKEHGLSPQQTAYVLATAFWETARTMQPVEEAFFLGSRADAYRRKLRYYPWYGRGFVQLTWEDNYIRAGKEVGENLIAAPNLAMQPDIAAHILVVGSRDGWFTGKKLSDYINASGADYIQARRVINGLDAVGAIADIALDYERAITDSPAYPNLRRGDRGRPVFEAQQALAAHGVSPGVQDGIFGHFTDTAVRAFQAKRGLTVDGIIGPKTWAELVEV